MRTLRWSINSLNKNAFRTIKPDSNSFADGAFEMLRPTKGSVDTRAGYLKIPIVTAQTERLSLVGFHEKLEKFTYLGAIFNYHSANTRFAGKLTGEHLFDLTFVGNALCYGSSSLSRLKRIQVAR